jgi:hypothetical protein
MQACRLVWEVLCRFVLAPLAVLIFLAHKYWKTRITIDAVEKFLWMQQMIGPVRYAYVGAASRSPIFFSRNLPLISHNFSCISQLEHTRTHTYQRRKTASFADTSLSGKHNELHFSPALTASFFHSSQCSIYTPSIGTSATPLTPLSNPLLH